VQHEELYKDSRVFCKSLALRSKRCCPFLTATSTTDKSSAWGIGQVVGGNVWNFLFLSFRLATETSHLRDISVRCLCRAKCYFYTQHRYLSETPFGLHMPSVTLSVFPSEFKPLPFIEVTHDLGEHKLQTYSQKSPRIWTPWLSYRTRQQSRASSLFDANMEYLSVKVIQKYVRYTLLHTVQSPFPKRPTVCEDAVSSNRQLSWR
jgi:hypothetical protein